MSPDAGNITPSGETEDTDTMKTKEVSSWFKQLMVNRMLPLSSGSPIDIGMPSIVSGICRKISDFSNQVIHLPILRATSLPVLNGPIKHSNVLGRLIDLPLLRPRRRQTNKNLKISSTSILSQIYRKKYAHTDDLYDYKYSDSKDAYEEKEQFDASIEPFFTGQSKSNHTLSEGIGDSEAEFYQTSDGSMLPEQIEMIKLVSEGKLFDAGYGKETIKNHLASIEHVHSAEYRKKQLHPRSVSDLSKSVIQKLEKPFNSELPGLRDAVNTANTFQKQTGIQPYDLIKNKQTGENARADYARREPGTVFIPHYEAVDREYIDSIPVEKDVEHIEDGHTIESPIKQKSTDIGKTVNKPTSIEKEVESLKKNSDVFKQNVPLTHPPSILQRAYTKIKDTVLTPGVKALNLIYRTASPPSEKTTLERKLPVESKDSYYQGVSPKEIVTPVAQVNITDEPSDINDIRPLISEDKTVIEMLSSMIDSEDKSVSPVTKSSTTTIKESNTSEVPSASMTPLIKPLVNKPSIQRIMDKTRDIPLKLTKHLPIMKLSYKPVLSNDIMMTKSEVPVSYPDFVSSTGLPGHLDKIDTDILESSTGQFLEDIHDKKESPEVRQYRTMNQASSKKNLSNQIMKQHRKESDSQVNVPSYEALDLLFAIKEEPMRIPDITHSTGISSSHFQADSVDKIQPKKEPINLLERYLADRRVSKEASDDKNKIVEMAPVISKQVTGDSLSRETLISRSASESAASSTDERIASRDSETESPDIDAIARDVYIILKRRLFRERERAFGLS